MVADTIRRALEFIPEDRLVITADCGFGREGLSRRIAYYKCVSLVLGTNIVIGLNKNMSLLLIAVFIFLSENYLLSSVNSKKHQGVNIRG